MAPSLCGRTSSTGCSRRSAALEHEGAASIADEIGALRVAGVRIHLLPTATEIEALRAAIVAAEPISRSPGSSLARLKALLDEA